MKKLLGSLFFIINLYANEYFFETSINKTKIYVNEPILLNVSFFKDVNLDYINSKFEPKVNNFQVKFLQKMVSGRDDYLITNYKYLLTPLSEGNFSLNLQAQIEEVTASSVVASTVGKNQASLDEALDKSIKSINLKPLNIEVLENSESFVGNIKVKTSIENTKVVANNPINFEVEINFKGNIEKLSDINLSIKDVKVFADEPKKEFNFYNGLSGSIKQKFALVGNSNFTIPTVSFKYLNPEIGKIEMALSKEIKVEVEPNEEIVKKLLDEPEEELSLDYLKDTLIYLFFTIFGFILCKLIKIPKRKIEVTTYEEIENTKSAKELLQLLFKYHKNKKILKFIERVELMIYSNSKDNLNAIKKEVVEVLKNGNN